MSTERTYTLTDGITGTALIIETAPERKCSACGHWYCDLDSELCTRCTPNDCPNHDPRTTKVEVRGWSRDGAGETWHCRTCGARVF